jgi:serine/threonine protein kinase
MPLTTGTRIGSYEVVDLLGSGGMGEVYRARDTRLNRDVAIKVLPEAFASDAERLARFKREAQVLASLNHAHIAAIYGLEETPSGNALDPEVMCQFAATFLLPWARLGPLSGYQVVGGTQLIRYTNN